jgi:hypothetical protein
MFVPDPLWYEQREGSVDMKKLVLDDLLKLGGNKLLWRSGVWGKKNFLPGEVQQHGVATGLELTTSPDEGRIFIRSTSCLRIHTTVLIVLSSHSLYVPAI